MQIRLYKIQFIKERASLDILPCGKLLINTINAHSYNTARKDKEFAETSFTARLLTELLEEPKEAQMLYELLKSDN